MTPSNQTTHVKMPSPLAAGLTGIVLGAAGAAAIALSDDETRKKATKKALQLKKDLQKWSKETIKELQTKKEIMQDTELEDAKKLEEL